MSGEARESYRHLLMQMHFELEKQQHGRAFMVTPCTDTDHSIAVALELAECLAVDHSRKVLIVDIDFSGNSLAKKMKMASAPGLLNLLDDQPAEFNGVMQPTGCKNTFFLPAGETNNGISLVASSGQMKEYMDKVRKQFDDIILCGTSVLGQSTMLVFPSLVDCVLLLIAPGRTRRSEAQKCHRLLNKAKARKIGLIKALR